MNVKEAIAALDAGKELECHQAIEGWKSATIRVTQCHWCGRPYWRIAGIRRVLVVTDLRELRRQISEFDSIEAG